MFAAGRTSQAQQLYSENFDVDHTANWVVNSAHGTPATNSAEIFFDYSTVGIPSAPGSGGTTRGMRLMANKHIPGALPGVFSGISASPVGLALTGDYEVRFMMWHNYNGPAPGGGNGSTQVTGAGIGSAGTTPQWVGGVHDCLHFGATGDGGSGQDYRVYPVAALAAPASGYYAAGTVTTPTDARNNSHPYYSTLGGGVPPAAQTTLFAQQTGTAAAGAPAFAWRTNVIKKVGNTATWSVDNKLIATVDISSLTFGGGNIVFNQSDINTTTSSEVNSTNLLFGLVDNITVSNISATVSVSVPTPDATETGPADGTITLTRAGVDTSGALTVNFTLTGTAVNGTDYTNASGASVPTSVTFLPNETITNITIRPVDELTSELTETVILTVIAGPGYALGIPASGTVNIADNDAQVLQISGVLTNLYEHSPYDYGSVRITRLGDLNFPNQLVIDVQNIVFAGLGGTAVSNVDFALANLPIAINPAEVSVDVNLVTPLDDALLEGTETIKVGLAAGGNYTVTADTATLNLIEDEYVTPERILFADNLNGDSSANWKTNFAANNGVDDYTVDWGYALSTDGVPNAPNGSATALKLTVNKGEPTANGAAGLNLYPLGQSFSNNFALRFNMFMLISSGATTEYSVFGINHSGNGINWNIQNGAGTTTATNSDGYWCAASADGSGSSPGDYCFLRGNGPTSLPVQVATASGTLLLDTFKAPPFAFAGGLGHLSASTTPTWVDVEVRKVNNTITWRINNKVITSVGNATNYSSGTVMIGCMDPYLSIGSGGAVYYSNLRVVNLTPSITAVAKSGGNLVINFLTSDLFDTGASFKVQSATSVTGPYTDDNTASIALLTTGSFEATIPYVPGAALYYRIRHQ